MSISGLQKYTVYYTKDADADLSEWSTKDVDGDQLETVVEDQEEDTPYFIRMQASTVDGPGIVSESIEVMTGKKRMN